MQGNFIFLIQNYKFSCPCPQFFCECMQNFSSFSAAILKISIDIDFPNIQGFKVHTKIARFLQITDGLEWYKNSKKLLFQRNYPKIFQNFFLNQKIFRGNRFFRHSNKENLKEQPQKQKYMNFQMDSNSQKFLTSN